MSSLLALVLCLGGMGVLATGDGGGSAAAVEAEVGSGLADTPAAHAPAKVEHDERFDWCRTPIVHPAGGPLAGDECPTHGLCDEPAVRDSWIPNEESPLITVRLTFHVFAHDDGSGAVSSIEEVAAQVQHLNQDFLPSGFQFIHEARIVNDSQFRDFVSSENIPMKTQYALSPAVKLNVFVVNNQEGYSMGTFPWDPNALEAVGGIIMHSGHFGSDMSILTHEVGHNVGLWHTHHGVSEVGSCSVCYEMANGANADTTGDFCGDTDPTPVNWSCGPPGGSDSCSGTPWGETDWQNYMGYASQQCYIEFSPHQMGRQRCWFDAVLTSWGDECDLNGGNFPDCDTDGIPDYCEADFDGDGTIDDCDDDIDDDGVPNDADVCDETPFGTIIKEDGSPMADGDLDCDVDIDDYRFLATCLQLSGPGNSWPFPQCGEWFDFDESESIDVRDVAVFLEQYTGSQP